MSAEASITVGEIDTSTYGWAIHSNTTIEENWWLKYGRFVEYQLIVTSGENISDDSDLAKGVPKPAMSGTYTCLGSIAKIIVNNGFYTSDTFGVLKTVTAISSGVRTVLHGVYISET